MPRAFAAARPDLTRSEIRSRSNCAIPARMVAIIRPRGAFSSTVMPDIATTETFNPARRRDWRKRRRLFPRKRPPHLSRHALRRQSARSPAARKTDQRWKPSHRSPHGFLMRYSVAVCARIPVEPPWILALQAVDFAGVGAVQNNHLINWNNPSCRDAIP